MTTTTDVELGRSIHYAMWDRQVTQVQLAARLDIDQSTLSKKLRGRIIWTVADLLSVAAALHVDPSTFLPKLSGPDKGGPSHSTNSG